jgi:hypothetical protein
LSRRSSPIAVAERPKRMKIAEKLATKSNAGPRTRRQPASPSSDGRTPVTADR